MAPHFWSSYFLLESESGHKQYKSSVFFLSILRLLILICIVVRVSSLWDISVYLNDSET